MSKNKDEAHFWFELERVEQRLGSNVGSGASRAYAFVERRAAQGLASYENYMVDKFNRVGRVRQALDQSGPMAQRLAMQQLSGIGLSTVWDILIAACKEIALYYGGAVVTGAVVGGAVGAIAFGVGALPGAAVGTAAGAKSAHGCWRCWG